MREPVDWPTRDLLAHRALATPERTALRDADTGESWTFREFENDAEGFVPAIERATPAAEGRVALLLDDPLATARLLFAAMRRAISVVPLNTRLTADELATRIEKADPDLLVSAEETEERAVEAAAGEVPVASLSEPVDGSVDYLAGTETAAAVPATLRRDTEALVLFTSGTTGEPKGVRLTVGNLVASATASAFRLGVTPDDRWLCCLPTYHMGGLAPIVRSTLYGTTAVVQREFDATATAAVIGGEGITGVSLVPTMLKRMLDDGWAPPDHLRFVLLGGAPASPELLDRCADRDVPVCPTYGMTETASQIATARPEQAFEHEGTVGQPLLCTEVTVVDPETNEPLHAGEPGELVVDGPTVTPGYLGEQQTAAAFTDRGLHTGDVGYRDTDGRLWVQNRLDDRIVSGGENVDPGEVRAALRAHDRIEDAAVVGLDDEEWGERVGALVVPNDDSLTTSAVEAHCRERLAGFKLPRTVAFADELPRTASGTVDREAVRERLRAAAEE
jgi:O-succinylbenzoic acid--CoA ligase